MVVACPDRIVQNVLQYGFLCLERLRETELADDDRPASSPCILNVMQEGWQPVCRLVQPVGERVAVRSDRPTAVLRTVCVRGIGASRIERVAGIAKAALDSSIWSEVELCCVGVMGIYISRAKDCLLLARG